MKLYYHKTSGGAEYLTDQFVICPNGSKEAILKTARYIIRIDGNISQDAELIRAVPDASLVAALEACQFAIKLGMKKELAPYYNAWAGILDAVDAAIAKARGE